MHGLVSQECAWLERICTGNWDYNKYNNEWIRESMHNIHKVLCTLSWAVYTKVYIVIGKRKLYTVTQQRVTRSNCGCRNLISCGLLPMLLHTKARASVLLV